MLLCVVVLSCVVSLTIKYAHTMKIEIIALHAEGYEEYHRDFDTMKEARAWIKECGIDRDYWNRRYERDQDYDGAARDNIHTIQLFKDSECVQDWFPEFK